MVKNNTAKENYVLGRMDYTISEKDSFFARYFTDLQHAIYPYSGSPLGLWGELDLGDNQFFTMEERHIFSPTMVNTLRASFSRTNSRPAATNSYPALQFFPGRGARTAPSPSAAAHRPRYSARRLPCPNSRLQNRFSEGDDIAWTMGSHSFRFGGSIDRVQSSSLWPFQAVELDLLQLSPGHFLAGTALSVAGARRVRATIRSAISANSISRCTLRTIGK